MKTNYYYDNFDQSIKSTQDVETEYYHLISAGFFPIDDNTTVDEWVDGFVNHQNTKNITELVYSLKCLHCSVCKYFNHNTLVCENHLLIKLCAQTPEEDRNHLINGEWCSGFQERS